VTVVHWRIIANLGLNSDPNLPRIAVAVHAGASTELFIVQWARGKGSSPGKVEGSSRGREEGSSCAMLATARPSCLLEAGLPEYRRLPQTTAVYRSLPQTTTDFPQTGFEKSQTKF